MQHIYIFKDCFNTKEKSVIERKGRGEGAVHSDLEALKIVRIRLWGMIDFISMEHMRDSIFKIGKVRKHSSMVQCIE